jgi:hypothetical protein
MEEEQPDWRTKDASIPLLLSGVISTVLCIGFCALMYLSRDYISSELMPDLGFGPRTSRPPVTTFSTPAAIQCPSVPERWRVMMKNDFDANKFGWQLGEDSNEDAASELKMQDGLLYYDITARQGGFSFKQPVAMPVKDFYLSSTLRKIEGPEDAEYGLSFSHIDHQVYFLSIQDAGLVKVHLRYDNNQQKDYVFAGYSAQIHKGEANDLVVFSDDDHYVFCINQIVAGEIDIDDYRAGQVGVAMELENAGDRAILEYDDLILYTP